MVAMLIQWSYINDEMESGKISKGRAQKAGAATHSVVGGTLPKPLNIAQTIAKITARTHGIPDFSNDLMSCMS